MEWYLILFFRFLNFFSLLAIFYYLYRRSIVPLIRTKIEKQIAHQTTIQERQHTLEVSLSTLQAQIEKNRILYEQLQEKIIAWKTITEEKERQKKEREATLFTELQKRDDTQKQNQLYYAMQIEEIKATLALMHDGLIKKYEQAKNREQFCTMIIKSFRNNKKRVL